MAFDYDLDDFPGVHVAVDLAFLTVSPPDSSGGRQLLLMVVRRKDGFRQGEWTLPGRFLRPRETVIDAAEVCGREKAGIHKAPWRKLTILDDPDRDPRGWTMSVGVVAPIPFDQARKAIDEDSVDRALVPVSDTRIMLPNGQPELPFGLNELVDKSVSYMRDRYYRLPDPKHFLGETFTLSELQSVHDAILGEGFYSRDSFRRTFERLLTPTGEFSSGTVGKPAALFRRARRSPSGSSMPRRINRPSEPRISKP